MSETLMTHPNCKTKEMALVVKESDGRFAESIRLGKLIRANLRGLGYGR
jgi:hypothetical protein